MEEAEEEYSGGDDYAEGEEPSSPELPKKRPARACDFCRQKKIKCEGNPCAQCRQHSQECTYKTQTRKRPLKKDGKYLAKLEAHARRLEARFAESAPDAYAAYKIEERRSSGDGSRHPGSKNRRVGLVSDPLSLTVPPNAILLADDMGIGGYLGPTSPWLFLHETRGHAARILHVESSASSFLNRYEFHIGTLHQYSPMGREKENEYINAWFNYSKSFHGCLHRPTFDNNRSTRQTPNGPDSYAFYSVFHAVLGLGAFILAEHDRCKQFMQVAWTSLMKVIFTSQSLLTIQALQLLSFLQLLLGRYAAAHSLLGHAIKLLYAIGLHRNSNVMRQDGVPLNAVEIEERRRTFWAIYFMESILSFILGRPPAISESDIDVEMPLFIPDAQITVDGILPEDIETQADEYLYESLRTLCEQLRKIFHDLYGPHASKDRQPPDLANSIGSVGGDLAGWRASMVAGHRPFKSAEDPVNFVGASPDQLYFSLAYYFCQCLIHRPALVEAVQRPTEVPHDEVPQRSPRRGKSPVKQYINPRAHRVTPLNEDLAGYSGRAVIAARDVFNLIGSAAFSTTNQSSVLLPAIVTAGSILVDNLIRDPSATSADADLRLLQNLKESLDTTSPSSQPLSDYEHIALAALQRLAPPRAMPRISDPPPFFQQTTTPQQWNHPFPSATNPYIALPMSGFDATLLQSSNNFSHSASMSQPYSSIATQYTFPQYQPPEPATSSSMANVRQQIIPTSQMIQSPHTMQPRQGEGGGSHWVGTGSLSTHQSTIQHSPQQHHRQPPQYPWPGTSWETIPPTQPPQPSQPQSPQPTSRPPRGSGHVKRQSRSRGSHR